MTVKITRSSIQWRSHTHPEPLQSSMHLAAKTPRIVARSTPIGPDGLAGQCPIPNRREVIRSQCQRDAEWKLRVANGDDVRENRQRGGRDRYQDQRTPPNRRLTPSQARPQISDGQE